MTDTERIRELEADVLRLTRAQEALRWLVHLHSGVGKAGGTPEDGEFESAIEAGKAALTAPLEAASSPPGEKT